MKIHQVYKNGYDWNSFMKTFQTYITKKEEEEVEQEIGLRKVEEVEGGRHFPEASCSSTGRVLA
jgi:hypothetical protein